MNTGNGAEASASQEQQSSGEPHPSDQNASSNRPGEPEPAHAANGVTLAQFDFFATEMMRSLHQMQSRQDAFQQQFVDRDNQSHEACAAHSMYASEETKIPRSQFDAIHAHASEQRSGRHVAWAENEASCHAAGPDTFDSHSGPNWVPYSAPGRPGHDASHACESSHAFLPDDPYGRFHSGHKPGLRPRKPEMMPPYERHPVDPSTVYSGYDLKRAGISTIVKLNASLPDLSPVWRPGLLCRETSH